MTLYSNSYCSPNKSLFVLYRGMSLIEHILINGGYPTLEHHIVHSLLEGDIIYTKLWPSPKVSVARFHFVMIDPNPAIGNSTAIAVPQPPSGNIRLLFDWEVEMVRLCENFSLVSNAAVRKLLQLIMPATRHTNILTSLRSTLSVRQLLREFVVRMSGDAGYLNIEYPRQTQYATINEYIDEVERCTRQCREGVILDEELYNEPRFQEVFKQGLAPGTRARLSSIGLWNNISKAIPALKRYDNEYISVLQGVINQPEEYTVGSLDSLYQKVEAKQSRSPHTQPKAWPCTTTSHENEPSPRATTPPAKTSSTTKPKYCTFHKSATHSTTECRTRLKAEQPPKERKRKSLEQPSRGVDTKVRPKRPFLLGDNNVCLSHCDPSCQPEEMNPGQPLHTIQEESNSHNGLINASQAYSATLNRNTVDLDVSERQKHVYSKSPHATVRSTPFELVNKYHLLDLPK
ncbi:hypothetical protein NEHOM01_1515 [Nematocida homosporus]|uniref:uncharacterized protein n=1 Tax=Nematocida homosporus TaxID=1912981 RepID=UPI00221F1F26|nr:uncharacterized protein NEHOM01_1515 [Nematocida homosporus]KAI5186515.1 hypothetical protein NEHOM01_1515 [Nematocida homosporus]